MENVVLIIHLVLALTLIGVVLMQRSEGGGLGMGSSGGGAVAGRSAATALGKVTWMLAAAFICTSITLTVLAAQNASGTSVIDRTGAPEASQDETPATPSLPSAEDLLPPSGDESTPLVPRAD